MKVIFLDIDFVLNSRNTSAQIQSFTGKKVVYGPVFVEEPFTRENLNWGKRMVDNLHGIVNRTGAVIVISSTWGEKFLYPYQYANMFKAYGWDAPVIDITPRYLSTRGEEIDAWMWETQTRMQKDINSYVILDDNDDFSNDQKRYWVKTDPDHGLTADDAKAAINILNK